MKYILETRTWAGGKDTKEDLEELSMCIGIDFLQRLEECLEDIYKCSEDFPTETTINDLLWFERDWIAECLLRVKNYDLLLDILDNFENKDKGMTTFMFGDAVWNTEDPDKCKYALKEIKGNPDVLDLNFLIRNKLLDFGNIDVNEVLEEKD